jgi:cell division protein YceG involved in septum cleavage
MTTAARRVLDRILDVEDISSGWITVHLRVRSDLKELFEKACKDSGTEAEGHLWQATYEYSDSQQAEVILFKARAEDLVSLSQVEEDKDYELRMHGVRITDED